MMSHFKVGVSLRHGSHLFHENVWNEVGDIGAYLVSAHHPEVRAVTAGLDSDLCIIFEKNLQEVHHHGPSGGPPDVDFFLSSIPS